MDKETGLHYNYSRYYDPSSGRYLKPDPINLFGGFNLFVYTNCSPLNHADPYGLKNTGQPPVPFDPNIKVPDWSIILRELMNFLNFWNAGTMFNEASGKLHELSNNILCGNIVRAHVCFHPGPPPRRWTLFAGLGFDILRPPEYQCYFVDIMGKKDCIYECLEEEKRRQLEEEESQHRIKYQFEEWKYYKTKREINQWYKDLIR